MGDLFNSKGADFSEDRKYRYTLWRIWDHTKPLVMFIGLNPSTANEYIEDRTITRVVGFAQRWGYGGVYMMNLFSFVSTKPKHLKTCDDPVNGNDQWLTEIAAKCDKIIFAWGRFPVARQRSIQVINMFPNAYALKILKNGYPQHPLMVHHATDPIIFQGIDKGA